MPLLQVFHRTKALISGKLVNAEGNEELVKGLTFTITIETVHAVHFLEQIYVPFTYVSAAKAGLVPQYDTYNVIVFMKNHEKTWPVAQDIYNSMKELFPSGGLVFTNAASLQNRKILFENVVDFDSYFVHFMIYPEARDHIRLHLAQKHKIGNTAPLNEQLSCKLLLYNRDGTRRIHDLEQFQTRVKEVFQLPTSMRKFASNDNWNDVRKQLFQDVGMAFGPEGAGLINFLMLPRGAGLVFLHPHYYAFTMTEMTWKV